MRSFVLFALMLLAFTTQAQRNSRDKDKPHHEDLSVLRPRFEPAVDTAKKHQPYQKSEVVQARHTVNEKVDGILDSIDNLNSLKRFIPGFTIQIYSGQNREDANNTKKKMLDELEMRADMVYEQPKFIVKTGKYFTSIEAQKDLVKIRRSFPNAILVPESIPVK